MSLTLSAIVIKLHLEKDKGGFSAFLTVDQFQILQGVIEEEGASTVSCFGIVQHKFIFGISRLYPGLFWKVWIAKNKTKQQNTH